MPIEKPFTYQYILDRWADGLKVLGAGNSAGLLASAASFQFFANKPEIIGITKCAAVFFLVGSFLFAIAFFILTILPLGIERFVLASRTTYNGFFQLMNAFSKDRENLKLYGVFIVASILSFLFFIIGLLQAISIIVRL